MDIVCFHNPNEENGYLSNWYASDFSINGINFSSMEQYMMFKKADCFKDHSIAQKILDTNDVAVIKLLGRQVAGYDDNIWNGMRQIIVYEGLLQKFSQNQQLKDKLKSTKSAILAECAVKDQIWGIGLSMNDPKRMDINQWRGKRELHQKLENSVISGIRLDQEKP